MTAMFESKSVANLLARNFETIRRAYQVLAPEGVYDEFVDANEEILSSTPESDLKDFLDGLPISIYGSSASMSRLHSLQYAYLLTRYAEKAASENRFENSLMVLAEACYFSGFAEGQGIVHDRQSSRVDPSIAARHAALTRHTQQSEPVKKRFLELLKSESRPEKWKTLAAAIRKHELQLIQFVIENSIKLKPENLPDRITAWCDTDTDFQKELSELIAFEDAASQTDNTGRT